MYLLADAYAEGWESATCAFVLSTGRCGTKTLAAMLGLSPEIHAVHEPVPRLVKSSFDAYLAGRDAAGDEWRRVVLAARDDQVFACKHRGRIWVETNNRMTYLAAALMRAFPASRFIHLYRDPYLVIRSGLSRGWYQQHTWDFARLRPRPQDDLFGNSWAEMTPAEKIAWFWQKSNQVALEAMDELPQERKLSVRSEDMFNGSEQTICGLFDFLGVAPPELEQARALLANRLNESAGARAEERPWSDGEHRTISRMVAGVALKLGYGV